MDSTGLRYSSATNRIGDRIFDFVIVGSGPAGMSAALSLVTEGKRVAVIDGGVSIDVESATFAHSLAARDPSEWTELDWRALRSSLSSQHSAIPEKRVWGSDYATRQIVPVMESSSSREFGVTGSFAVGGLSNIWGAALLRLRPEDVKTWPFDYAELEAGYSAIESILPITGIEDSLARAYPAKIRYRLNLSLQSQWLLENLSRAGIDAENYRFGAARLAINNECRHCNGCMYGCVYDAIFSSRKLLDLPEYQAIAHLSGWIVDELEEGCSKVRLRLKKSNDSTDFTTIEARRVVLACGALYSAHLLLKSVPERLSSVTLRDSQHFILPLWLSGFRRALDKKMRTHSLAQIFMEIEDLLVSRHPIHLQFYSYMMPFVDRIRAAVRLPRVVADPIAHQMAWKMMAVQGYLHSEDSSCAELKLTRASGLLHTNVVRSDRIDPLVERVLKNMRQIGRKTGFGVFPVGLTVAPFGGGCHVGATFPMRTHTDDPATSDVLGRPAGMERTHLVDASILPEIPSTTITFTVMANAFRIGKQIANLH